MQVRQRFFAQGKQRSFERFEGGDQFGPVGNFTPVISGLCLPGRTAQGPARNGAAAGRLGRVVADLRGIRVGRIQQQVDALLANVLCQSLCAAIPADPHLAVQVSRYAAHTRQAVNVLRSQRAGNGQCFGDPAE